MGMTKKLLVVFVSGLVLAMILLSSAFVLGGPELRKRINNGKGVSVTVITDRHGPRTSRSFVFDPAKPLALDVAAKVRFTRGDKVSMEVTGPQKLVNALTWEDGKLASGGGIQISGDGIEVAITAPRLDALILRSAAEVRLQDLDQPSLRVDSRGAIELDASGRVDTVEIETAGASDVDFRNVAARDARIVTKGAGDVTIAATGKVDVEINGAGSVSLRSKPEQLTSKINGVGSVDHDY
jgi:hypothetical protein